MMYAVLNALFQALCRSKAVDSVLQGRQCRENTLHVRGLALLERHNIILQFDGGQKKDLIRDGSPGRLASPRLLPRAGPLHVAQFPACVAGQ